MQTSVKPAEGKLGIMIVGNGAVATTFMTGVLMTRRGLTKPIGSMTQYDKIRVGKGTEKKYLHYKDIVPLASLDDIVFGTWDVYPQNAYQAAMYAEVLKEKDINPVKDELEKIKPMKAAFDKNYAKRLDGDNVKDCKTRWEMVEALREDIRNFKKENNCSREKTKMPISGKDFKTGQTLVKSGFAQIIGTRCLGLSGWFSTNILGNRDGLVLDEPANFHTKEVSKLSTLETILKPDVQPDLYGHGNDEDTQYYHKVRINYYPPRNDNKEGWDNIDIFGWMGYPMQVKINFLCRDSILAAPLLLDLCLLSDLAARAGRYGTQRFLSFFLKSPMHDYTKGEEAVNNLYQQYTMLKNAIREMGGYEADEEID